MMPAVKMIEETDKPSVVLRIGIRKSPGGIFWYNRCARMLEEAPEEAMARIRVSFAPFFPEPVTLSHFRQFLPAVGLRGDMKVVLVIGDEEHPGGAANAKRRQEVWQHSRSVARIAEFIALWVGSRPSPEEAYQAGLLHDCTTAVLGEEVRAHHPAAGELMARVWGQTPAVCQAVRYHHQATPASWQAMEDPRIWMVLRLAGCLYDVLTGQKTFDTLEERRSDAAPVDILAALGLRQREIRDILEDTGRLLRA